MRCRRLQTPESPRNCARPFPTRLPRHPGAPSPSLTTPIPPPPGHIFCSGCIEPWLAENSSCPECRAPVESPSLAPDRFADSMVSNLLTYCAFRHSGCEWVGKRGDRHGHMARECQHVIVGCPNLCGEEFPRANLFQHLNCCSNATLADCPWGCGAKVASSGLDEHKAECLLEPRKLLAAIQKLHLENQRLTQENERLTCAPCEDEDESGLQTPRTVAARKVRARLPAPTAGVAGPGCSFDE